jgi:O-acetyl-ADP-ribose deacetylase (regulator of RNase III)
VQVEPKVWVANMIGQQGIKRSSSGPPIRYDAVAACLDKVSATAKQLKASVHMPRIGCGLAGCKWTEIEPLVEERLVAAGIPVTVYDYE